jgi:peptidoglycan/LPS O-acetylase OafA/YrhL
MAMLQEHPIVIAFHHLVPSVRVPTRFGSSRPLWTVAVEWWIYLTFGWIFLRGRWSREQVGRVPGFVILALFAAVPIWNLFGGYGNGLTMTWMLGGALAVILARQSGAAPSQRSSLLVALGFALAGFVRIYVVTRDAYDPLFATLLSFALFFFVVGMQSVSLSPNTRTARAIGFLADYSYVLYLLHYSVLECFLPLRELPAAALVLLSLVTANIASALLASVTEMRHRQWTKKALLWVEGP